jgi:hypothetical protein
MIKPTDISQKALQKLIIKHLVEMKYLIGKVREVNV